MTLTLALQVAGVFLMMGPGFLLRRRGTLSAEGTAELARLVVLGIYPCLIFAAVVRNYRLGDLLAAWPLPAAVFGLMAGGYALGRLVAWPLRFSTPAQGNAFLFQCAFNNYSFLPMPLVAVLYGERAVAALLVSSLGAELAVWTLGVYVLNGRRFDARHLRHLVSPPLLALAASLLAVAWRDAGPVPDWARSGAVAAARDTLLQIVWLVGQATVPLSMVVAGSCLAMLAVCELRNGRVWIAALVRVGLIPVLALSVLLLLPLAPEQRAVLAVVAVMPSAIASITLAKVYGGDEDFAAGTVLLTHLAALVTVPLLLAAVR